MYSKKQIVGLLSRAVGVVHHPAPRALPLTSGGERLTGWRPVEEVELSLGQAGGLEDLLRLHLPDVPRVEDRVGVVGPVGRLRVGFELTGPQDPEARHPVAETGAAGAGEGGGDREPVGRKSFDLGHGREVVGGLRREDGLMRLCHRTLPDRAERIMEEGFRGTPYEVDDVDGPPLRGVHLCGSRGGPPSLGDAVICVEIPERELEARWQLDCLCLVDQPIIPKGDWCIPAEVVNRHPRSMVSPP